MKAVKLGLGLIFLWVTSATAQQNVRQQDKNQQQDVQRNSACPVNSVPGSFEVVAKDKNGNGGSIDQQSYCRVLNILSFQQIKWLTPGTDATELSSADGFKQVERVQAELSGATCDAVSRFVRQQYQYPVTDTHVDLTSGQSASANGVLYICALNVSPEEAPPATQQDPNACNYQLDHTNQVVHVPCSEIPSMQKRENEARERDGHQAQSKRQQQ